MTLLINKNFNTAVWLTSLVAIALFIFTFLLGNISFFLILNFNGGNLLDIFFSNFTKLAEVFPWLVALIFVLIYRKEFLVFLVCVFLISTILSQGIKNILPIQARPTKAIINLSQVHTVQGVQLHSVFSFPSGHTTTAFTIFLFFVLVFNKKWIVYAGFFYALLIGYSRIYLAQHFPVDIAGGMVCAIITLYVSIFILKKFSKGLLE